MTEAEKIAAAVARRADGIAAAGSKAAWVAGLLSATVERVVDDDTGVTVDAEVSSDAPEVAAIDRTLTRPPEAALMSKAI